jgi:hypothetical protein
VHHQPQLIELRLIPGAAIDWDRHPDVVEVRRTEADVSVTLPTGRHDAALLTALNHGWSVVAVRQVNPG